jgi:shikimate kinase
VNIILIGFKGSGKTTIGKLLSESLGALFVDTDSLISALFHKKNRLTLSCREIFELKGEKYFRELEAAVLIELAGLNNAVVSTGGGAVLEKENIARLKTLGRIIFLDVPLDVLKKRLEVQNSPLFEKKSIEQIYNERYDRYLSIGERFAVDANDTPLKTTRTLYKHLSEVRGKRRKYGI